MLPKVLSWMKALTMPVLLIAATIGWLTGLADTTQWVSACSVLLAFWLGPKGYQAIKSKKAKNEVA